MKREDKGTTAKMNSQIKQKVSIFSIEWCDSCPLKGKWFFGLL